MAQLSKQELLEEAKKQSEMLERIGRWRTYSLVLSAIGLGSFLLSQTGEAKEAADPNAGGSKWKSMSHEEYEAMRWIDKNTPTDALLATDRYYTVNPEDFDVTDRWENRYFL